METEVKDMAIKYNVPGQKRKELVKEIAEWLGCNINYCGAPTFAYKVGDYTIDREGTLTFDGEQDSEAYERLCQHLYDAGFESTEIITDSEPHTSVSLPRPDDATIENLKKIVEAKGDLIAKAVGAKSLPIETDDKKIHFDWFPALFEDGGTNDLTEMVALSAYMKLCTGLVKFASEHKHVSMKKEAVENEKYAFRCFLLKLGFIGDGCKEERKILLRNFTGSSAFKTGRNKD